MTKFEQIKQAELKKGQERHGTPFGKNIIEARGENIQECIQKEAIGVWLYADQLGGFNGMICKVLARAIFWIGRKR